MAWVRRHVGWLLFHAALVPAVAIAATVVWLRSGLPSPRGTIAVAGIDAPVRIIRDRHAVPHIFARSEEDAFFALGFVHAQDRLWQMDMMRRLGAGRLAEILGPQALRFDRLSRTLGFYARAQASEAALTPEVRAALDAYAKGVNAWLHSPHGPLPLEFQILNYRPEPWQPADSLVWARLMAFQLSGNYRDALMRARMLQRLPPDQVDALMPRDRYDGAVTLAAALAPLSQQGIDLAALNLDHLWHALPQLGPAQASNEWVLAGSATATGKPILVNDPHLALNAPILWYLARIETPTLTLTGATVPGVPFPILGHNGRIAWGFTTTGSNVQDLFIERTDAQDPTRYLVPGGSEPFMRHVETIHVRGAADEVLTVRETRHGPVLSDIDPAIQGLSAPGDVIALAFTGLATDDTTTDALYRINHAANWAEFRAALQLYQSPPQNMVYADTDGHIGFMAPGRVPVRRSGDGSLPVPGWTGAFDWTGMIPFDALPQAVDPPSGRFVNANNAIVGPHYPYFLTTRWGEPARAERIEQVLATSNRHNVESAEDLLMDTMSLPALKLLPTLLQIAPSTPLRRAALVRLKVWDGRMERNSPQPLIFESWLRELNRVLFAERLGPLFDDYWSLNATVVTQTLSNGCGTVPCDEAVASAFDRALDGIAATEGDDVDDWRWGDAHRAPMAHPFLSRLPVLNRLFDIGIATDGGFYTINRGASRIEDPNHPFADDHGAGYRAVYDLSDLDNSQFMIATGQSGNPLSPHYGDLVTPWRDGAHFAIAGSPAAIAATGLGTLLLQPRPAPLTDHAHPAS